ncbi:unnamed protein product [Microthlaspi erraticum]|uniref:Uncharacterized protein n=1 Tax=Microthlaspi erraticum TaxID=1685480 RepID=A0A6D2KT58_9BRAS|nr:unnamed protein product [Microthlaspi erraticum]
MAKLEKIREKLTKCITYIGDMNTITTIVSIPGGLDANGHIRFGHQHQHTFYAETTFLLSVVNHCVINIDEALTQAQKIKSVQSTLFASQVLHWITAASALSTYICAFLLIYTDNNYHTKIIKTTDNVTNTRNWTSPF